MEKKQKIMTLVLAVVIVVFALAALYFNVLRTKPASNIDQVEKPIILNNTLKTSVTVLPAPVK
jgi:heme/copper-type cytochrome/quinol oxidase subunit 2